MSRQHSPLRLRGHHLLCTGLFVGEGYSDTFSVNMSRIVRMLKEENVMLELVCGTDEICGACPKTACEEADSSENREKTEVCDLPSVKKKDQKLLANLGLDRSPQDTYRNIIRIVRERLTESMFQECCGDCSWNKKGLCSYEKYMKNIED